MNLNDLMGLLQEKVLHQVDHKHLNEDVAFLSGVIPTAENIVIGLWEQIRAGAGTLRGLSPLPAQAAREPGELRGVLRTER